MMNIFNRAVSIFKIDTSFSTMSLFYVVGSKSFRPDIQKPRQMESAVRDI